MVVPVQPLSCCQELYHGEKLIEKLNAGKGIVTVVYGASNMEDGGWYGTTGKHKSRAPLDFWGVFMEGIQRRWPKTSVEMASGHGHVLLNLARVGTSLDNLFERSCSQSIYPNNADLVFIDPHTVPSSDHTLRYLVRQLLALPSPPAIAIITNVNSLQTNYGQRYKHVDSSRSNRAYNLMMLCISLGQPISKLKEQEAACNELGDRVFPNSTDDYQELREGYHQVAKDYGLAHIDLYQLLEVLIRENTKRLSVNEWALFASIYRDILHFNGLKDQVEINEEFGGGSRLLADTLLKWLDETRDRVNQLAKASDKSLEQSICYDVDLDKGQERCERLGQHICPYFSYQQQVDEIHRSIPDFKLDDLPLQVTRMEGFELRHYYNSTTGLKYKPEFVVSTDLGNFSSAAGPSKSNSSFAVVVTYTASYDGWANATLSCHENCTCDPVVAIGQLNETGKRASILENAHLIAHPMTQNCTIRVSIPPTPTDIYTYKFKITHVKVTLARHLSKRK